MNKVRSKNGGNEIEFEVHYEKPEKRISLSKGNEKPCGCSGNAIARSKGENFILVTRDKFELTDDLPYCIWGALYANMGFNSVLRNYIPAGLTLVTTVTGGTITFAYTSGAVTDTITVTVPSTALLSYPEMIAGLNTNYMHTELVIYNCNYGYEAQQLDNSQIQQLQEGYLYMQSIGGTGEKNNHCIFPSSRMGMNNSIRNILELSLPNEPIKPDTVWIHLFVNPSILGAPPPTAITQSFTVFASEVINMNEEKIGGDSLKTRPTHGFMSMPNNKNQP